MTIIHYTKLDIPPLFPAKSILTATGPLECMVSACPKEWSEEVRCRIDAKLHCEGQGEEVLENGKDRAVGGIDELGLRRSKAVKKPCAAFRTRVCSRGHRGMSNPYACNGHSS